MRRNHRLTALFLSVCMTAALLTGGPAARASQMAELMAEAGYHDVQDTDWYAPAVLFCRSKGLIDSTAEGIFAPELSATRAVVISALYRLNGSPAVSASSGFTDVPVWYERAAAWAVSAGIAHGYGGGRFGPDEPVTRQQLVTFLWRAEKRPAVTDSQPFTDSATVSAYAREAVRWARAAGAVGGYKDGSFRPRGTASRAHLAQILLNYAGSPEDKAR